MGQSFFAGEGALRDHAAAKRRRGEDARFAEQMEPFRRQGHLHSKPLAVYGAVAGLLHKAFRRKKPMIYCSLILAMIAGRLAWGAAMFACLGATGGSFTLAAFLAGAVTNAVPGIILQILLVPILVMVLDNPKILKLHE